jgi:RNA polymerase sigma-70 factor (ECF subfamily)
MDHVSRLTEWLGGAAARALGSTPADADDWRLWRQARQGHGPSATQLVRDLTPQGYGLAIQLLRRAEDAEDAVQESFLRLWRSEPSDTQGARLSTYFNTIVINRCRSLLVGRREQATEHEALTELHDAHQAQQAGIDEGHGMAGLSLQASQARLSRGLARLPARQRMAVAMWAYADASVIDIARALELDPNAAHQLLHRAKLALRSHLEGVTP